MSESPNPQPLSRPRVVWSPVRKGFISSTQDGSVTVKVLYRGAGTWHVFVNGQLRRVGSSEQWAKRLGRDFL